MLCTLVFVGYGHIFTNYKGSWFHKKCYYSCNSGPTTHWYNSVHLVDPFYTCPATYSEI